MDKIDPWTDSLVEATTALWTKLAVFLPNLLGFLLIIVIGYLVARLGKAAVFKLLTLVKADGLAERLGITGVLKRANLDTSVSEILAALVFWLLMLTFMVSATESLGLERVSSTIDGFVQYLPKVLGAVFILMVGLMIAQFVRGVITSSAEGIGSDYAQPLGTVAYAILVVVIVSLSVGQLELETALLNEVVSIVLLSMGVATALAFGLGARVIAGHILAGTYVRDLYKIGDRITVENLTGVVVEVSALKTEIRSDSGELITVSNSKMAEETVIRTS